LKLPIAFLAAAALVLLALFTLQFRALDFGTGTAKSNRERSGVAPPAGNPDRFEYLSNQTSNSCGLQPKTVIDYPDSRRLQGSCCSPMDREEYRRQVEGLNEYENISQIPADPYDIPASLAKLLLGYQSSIELLPHQQAIYDEAMQMTPEKGPCCCECWRWFAFEGMSKYLIQEHGWQSSELAGLIHLVDGCGGSHAGEGHGGRRWSDASVSPTAPGRQGDFALQTWVRPKEDER
jgi:hypothetical protein